LTHFGARYLEADLNLKTATILEDAHQPPDKDYAIPAIGKIDTANGGIVGVSTEAIVYGSSCCLHREAVVDADRGRPAGQRGADRQPTSQADAISAPPGGMSMSDGNTQPVAQAIPSARAPRKGRSAPRLILSLLSDVTSASALWHQAGVSRQRIYQILHHTRECRVLG
jgi:hypothetical protein